MVCECESLFYYDVSGSMKYVERVSIPQSVCPLFIMTHSARAACDASVVPIGYTFRTYLKYQYLGGPKQWYMCYFTNPRISSLYFSHPSKPISVRSPRAIATPKYILFHSA